MITQARLHQLLDYDQATGVFRWKVVAGNRRQPGEVAGTINKLGYVQINVHYELFYGHRLAWLYVYGTWPKEIDHKDRNRQNNAIVNLREGSRTQNLANKKVQSNNRLGIKGVRKLKSTYCVRVNGKHVGCYKTVEEAQSAYLTAARLEYGEFATCGA